MSLIFKARVDGDHVHRAPTHGWPHIACLAYMDRALKALSGPQTSHSSIYVWLDITLH